MKVNISSVKKERGRRENFSFTSPVTEVLPDGFAGCFTGDVSAGGDIANVGDVLLLSGVSSAHYKGECARCLEPLEQELEVEFCEKIFPVTAVDIEEDAYTFDGDFIDIKQIVGENLLMGEPVKMLCKDGCQGICPICGQNLNIKNCACLRETIDPRLAALEKFRKK